MRSLNPLDLQPRLPFPRTAREMLASFFTKGQAVPGFKLASHVDRLATQGESNIQGSFLHGNAGVLILVELNHNE